MNINENLKETIKHGKPSFPICVYKNYNEKNNLLHNHWHDEIELIYLDRGIATFYVNYKPIRLQEGQTIIVNSKEIHSGKKISSNDIIFYSIVFNPILLTNNFEDNCQIKFIEPLIKKKYKFSNIIDDKSSWGQNISFAINNIIKAFNNKYIAFELTIKSSLYQIIFELINNNKFKKSPKNYLHKIKKIKLVLNYIHDNYNGNISLMDMASRTNLSKYYFCHFFKSITGQTPIEYLNNYRINQACKRILDNPNKTILDISLEVGFNNISYFNRVFKKFKNCTPTEFKK